MKNSIYSAIGIFCLLYFLYLLIQFTYSAIISIPSEGDSLAYHIPIAHSVLSGTFLNPTYVTGYGANNILHFYPSNGEVILAILMVLNLPLNLFNVIGWLCLFIACVYVARCFSFTNSLAIIFATSVVTVHGIVRWLHSQTIDIWLAVFFALSLGLIIRPENKMRWYLLLGTVLGVLIGIKYSGIFLAAFLLVVYYRQFFKNLSLINALVFLLPVFTLGLFWYIRNIILMSNPFYPQQFLSFSGAENWNILEWNVGEMIISHPLMMLNAAVSEYMVWVLSFLLIPFFSVILIKRKVSSTQPIIPLLILTGMNVIFYLLLVSTPEYNIMVSSFRYSYPLLILMMLSTFVLARELNLLHYISFFVIMNGIVLLSNPYRPKMVFILLMFYMLFILVIQKYKLFYDKK